MSDLEQRVFANILCDTGGYVYELSVTISSGIVVLGGHSLSAYAKQIAGSVAVMSTNLALLNNIVVP